MLDNGKKYLILGLYCIYLTFNEIADYSSLDDWTSNFSHGVCEPPRKPAIMFLNPINVESQPQSFLTSSKSKVLTIIPVPCSSANFP